MDELRLFKNRLEFSEARFEAIAQTATDSIIISDENSFIVFANKKTYEIFGYKEGELIGLSLEVLIPEKYRKAHRAGVQRFIHSGIPTLIGHTIEIEGLRKDESVFPLELSLSSWQEEESYFFSGIIRDITKRKEQEKSLQDTNQELSAALEELQSAEEHLRELNNELEKRVEQRTALLEEQKAELHNLFMQVPALIGILRGREGRVELINATFNRLWGNRPVMGKTMREAWPELEGQGYFEFVESVYDTGEAVVRSEFPGYIDRHNTGTTELAYFDFVYAPYIDLDGKVDGVIIYGVDVTEHVISRSKLKELNEELAHKNEELAASEEEIRQTLDKTIELNEMLAERETRYRFLAEAMPQKIWTAKPDGDIDYFNQRWLDYTNLNFEALKGWFWKKVIHPDDYAENIKLWKQSIAQGTDFHFEHRFKRFDGEYRWHLSRGIAQKDAQGNVMMWVGTSTDIHDVKTAEEALILKNKELQKVNNDLDNFIYTASHDLKSPIANIEGLIVILHKKLEDSVNSSVGSILAMIEKSVTQFKRTIEELTEISKVQKNVEQIVEEVLFKEVLEDVKADLQEMIKQSGALIKENLQVKSMLYAKRNLRSILYNLLSNAIKYRSPKRAAIILINTYREDDFIVLRVKDNGLGVSPAQQAKIFEMFRRMHTHVEGTGIGLYIVKRIVENNGGRIEVESQLEQGTSFTIYFKTVN